MADTTTPPAAPAAASPAAASPAATSPTNAKAPAAPVSPPAAKATDAPKHTKPSFFVHKDPLFARVCRSFMARKCTRGASCAYIHDPQLCSFFYRTGDCKFGAECRKRHNVTAPADTVSSAAGATTADTSSSTTKKNRKSKKPKDALPAAAAAATNEPSDATKSAATKPKKKTQHKTKKNTECFDPRAAPVDLRVTFDLGSHTDTFSTPLSTRDVLLAPNLFRDFAPNELYTKLETELNGCGVPREQLLKLWHGNETIEGTHLIADDKTNWRRECPTFDLVIARVSQFFKFAVKATRFNWYVDTAQWKPFHFDAAAVKPEIAAKQNFTVGISFGATRDAAFEHARTKTVVSLPQPDGCVYAFARDTNVLWRHGILQDTPVREEGRISIIAWGWIDGMVDPTSKDAAATTL